MLVKHRIITQFPQTLILTRSDVERLADLKKVIIAIEKVFADYARGAAQQPPKIYLDLKRQGGDFRAMPAYWQSKKVCSLKWVNAHPGNIQKGLPTVMAVIVLNDPRTGFPLSIMDGTHLTSLRTAAAGAVAAKYLAKKNPQVVGMVGCGVQARFQLKALRELFNFREVKVFAPEENLVMQFIREMKIPAQAMRAALSIEECVKDCDIVVTTTPSRKPIIKKRFLTPGVHINAIGADAPGKQELDPQILKTAKIVVDDYVQAAHAGEINVAVKNKMFSVEDIHASLGEVITGKKKGRTNPVEITVFDSTGLAIQDTAAAQLIFETAVKKKAGRFVRMVV